MTVNVLGPITVSYYVLNSMRAHNKGAIINVASRAGVVTGAMSSAYSASKAALIRATGNIQQECIQEGKDGISLFSLHPGGVKTAMNESTTSLRTTLFFRSPSFFELFFGFWTEIVKSLVAPECDLIKPGTTERITKFADSFHHQPELTAHTCLFLASGKGSYLVCAEN